MATAHVEKAGCQSPRLSNIATFQSSAASLSRLESRFADAEVLAELELNVFE